MFDGGTWVRVPSPTSVTLSSIVVLPSGECAIGGQRGVLLVGRPDSLRVIELPTPEEDVMSCEYCDEKIFVSTRKRVFYLRENDLVACALKQGSGRPSAGFWTAAGGVLWSIGALLKMVFLVTTSATFVWDVARRVLRFASLIAFFVGL